MARTKGAKDKKKRTRNYNGRYHKSQITDIVLFEDPHDPKFYKRKCWWRYCSRIFWTNNPYLRYCADHCRTMHYNSNEYEGVRWLDRYTIVDNNYREERMEY